MGTEKLQELIDKFHVGQKLTLKITLDDKDENKIRKIRTCKVIEKFGNYILVEFTNLGKYKEAFKYTDFIAKDVEVLKWN